MTKYPIKIFLDEKIFCLEGKLGQFRKTQSIICAVFSTEKIILSVNISYVQIVTKTIYVFYNNSLLRLRLDPSEIKVQNYD